MIGVWTVLGILTGIVTALPFRGGVSEVFARAIAGALVYSLLGATLSLFASRAQESMVGGLCGTAVGLGAQWVHPAPLAGEVVSLCLTIGALVGATCWPWIRVLQAVGRYAAALLRGKRTAR
jgi:hypothetical protein